MKNKVMNLRKLNYAIVLLGLISMFACKREELIPIEQVNSLKEFYFKNQTSSQFFSVKADEYVVIKGKKGTVVKMWANSLQHQDGRQVTGNVTIELKEVFDKGDMVKSNLPSVSNGRLLVSQGEFLISAVQNGESLQIKPEGYIQVSIPNFSKAAGSMVFYGDSISNDSTPDPTDTIINWNPIDSTTINPYYDSIVDSTTGLMSFSFNIEGFGLIGLGYFNDNNNTTTITVTTDDVDPSNLAVCFVFRDIHATANPTFNGVRYVSDVIPIGYAITIVATSIQNGQFYSSFQDIIVTQDANIDIDLQPSTIADYNQTLASIH